jgi:hypothetical protein
MYSKLLIVLASVAIGGASGCQRAESPAAVQRDVAEARSAAAVNEARALEQQAKTEASAEASLARASDRAEGKVVTAAYDLAATDAEGSHRVAIAQCNALAGDAQKACREKADTTLAMAKAYAKASFAQRE